MQVLAKNMAASEKHLTRFSQSETSVANYSVVRVSAPVTLYSSLIRTSSRGQISDLRALCYQEPVRQNYLPSMQVPRKTGHVQ